MSARGATRTLVIPQATGMTALRRWARELALPALACGPLLLPPPAAAQERAELGFPAGVLEAMQARVERKSYMGIIVAVIERDGTHFEAAGLTRAGGPPPDRRTLFEIGSVTKSFTGILLADMVERGELSLEDPIATLLPAGVEAPQRDGRSITLVDLATHRSGLPRLPDNLAPADPANPYADYTIEDLYAFLSSYQLPRDIGSRYEYSNLGFGLLGNLLARRAATSYEELVRSRICDVLGMPDTRIELSPEQRGRLAQGHAGTVPVPNWDLPALAGAGALESTAADMALFVAANMKADTGEVDTELARALTASHGKRSDAGKEGMQVALAWHVLERGEREIVWHNGGTGGYRSFIGWVKGGDRGTVVLTNSSTGGDDIGFHLLDEGMPLQDLGQAVAVDEAVLESYAGRYELLPGMLFDIAVQNGQLTAQLTGQPRFPLYADSPIHFHYEVVAAHITFSTNANGEVTALVLHQGGVDQTARRLREDEQPPEHREIEIDAAVLQDYVGKYELAPGVVFDVTTRGARLMVQLTGQPVFPVFPLGRDEFFYKVVSAQITFERGTDGKVSSLILRQGGVDRQARRIE